MKSWHKASDVSTTILKRSVIRINKRERCSDRICEDAKLSRMRCSKSTENNIKAQKHVQLWLLIWSQKKCIFPCNIFSIHMHNFTFKTILQIIEIAKNNFKLKAEVRCKVFHYLIEIEALCWIVASIMDDFDFDWIVFNFVCYLAHSFK